jgi:coenzyme F420-reducing hydrogenase gamma subunit
MGQEDCEYLLSKLPEMNRVFKEYLYIPEMEYNRVLDAVVDNGTEERKGKHLNSMTTNRQRCMLLVDSKFNEHSLMEDEDKLSAKFNKVWAKEAKAKGIPQEVVSKGNKKCGNLACMAKAPSPGCQWSRCKGKNCRVYSCGLDTCNTMLFEHQQSIHGL